MLSSEDAAEPGRQPRAAATVVLVREGPNGLELLLTVRPRELAFMGGATVFPGGAVAAADRDPRWARAARAFGPSEAGRAARVCAIREAFEEVGWIDGDGPCEALERADAEHPRRFLKRCLELGVRLATDRLIAAGRWVTPPGSPARFDTQFFIAAADPRWEPAPDVREVANCYWSSPSGALDELAAGRSIMAPPTIEMLQRLASCSSVAEALGTPMQAPGEDILSARLSPVVQTVLAPNPGLMTGPGTNTYVVGMTPACVIDVAVPDPGYLDAIERAAARIGVIVVTHRHPDHVGGVGELARRSGAPVRAFGSADAGGVAVDPLDDGTVIDVAGARLRCLHTPGHSPDHVCLELEGAASLFSGDNILGEGTAVIAPPEGDMADYLASLKRLAERDIDRIYPGHWRPLDDGADAIARYLSHRAARANAILKSLNPGPKRPEEIVAEVYRDTPTSRHGLAQSSVLAHLELLEKEGRVSKRHQRWSLTGV